jgi:hypothetical protein
VCDLVAQFGVAGTPVLQQQQQLRLLLLPVLQLVVLYCNYPHLPQGWYVMRLHMPSLSLSSRLLLR